MHELPTDLTNSLRSFRGSIYRRDRTQQGDKSPRLDNSDIEKGPEDYGDKEFDRALNTSQSTLDMQSATSAPDMDQIQPDNRKEDVDVEKQDQKLRFEQDEEEDDGEDHDAAQGPERPRVDTSVDKPRKQPRLTPNTPGKQSILLGAHVKDLDPAADRLAEDTKPLSPDNFYELMGIYPPTSSNQSIQQLIKPGGLYGMINKLARYTGAKYRAFAIAVYVFLVLQLMISAVFIILGALEHVDTHIVIAILGAVSTVIAGALALMQGQGLPQRLRKTRDGLRDVLFAADELYWDQQTGRAIMFRDIKKIREDYLRVLEEQRNNNPDMWQSAAKDIETGISSRAAVEKR